MLLDATHLLIDATLPENKVVHVATGSMALRRVKNKIEICCY